MENYNKSAGSSSSPSSFTTDLFGGKDASPTSSFSSIFAPPSSVGAKNYSTSLLIGSMNKHLSGSESLNAGIQGDKLKSKDGVSNFVSDHERKSIYQERAGPCPLSSSLYYGAQEDMYLRSSSADASGSFANYKKDGEADDPNGNNPHAASRGNWWQGSLYY